MLAQVQEARYPRRIGDHRHYPIFAVRNPNGKNPSNVWEIATKAHFGNEHLPSFLKSW